MGDDSFRYAHPFYSSKLCGRISILTALILFLVLLTAQLGGPTIPTSGIPNVFTKASSLRHSDRLHFLLPSSEPNVNLCKAIVGATILGYPIPTLVNWGSNGGAIGSTEYKGAQMEKLYSVSEYLNTIDSSHDSDLVLVTDSRDMWFQLSPSILISRYHALNSRAQERIIAQLGYASTNITQTIVFGSEKKCWPGKSEDIGCYALPESQLPKTVYGPQTDVPGKSHKEDDENLFKRMRARYLNSGFVLGPAKDMRALYKLAAERARADPEVYGADQGIVAQIFGEQEYMRERNRLDRPAPWKRRQRMEREEKKIFEFGLPLDYDSRKEFVPGSGVDYEFHIGLDYEGSTGMPTAWAEHDSEWIMLGDQATIDAAVENFNISIPRVRGVQEDIARSPLPLSDLSDTIKNTQWADVPLFTNLWTGITPATIHHNAKHQNYKALRDEKWGSMWYAPHARELFDARVAAVEKGEKEMPVAIDESGRKWWSTISNEWLSKNGFGAETRDRSGAKGWARWSDLCNSESRKKIFDVA